MKSYFYKTLLIRCIVIGAFGHICFAQDTSNTAYNFWKNVQFGGGIGLNFGDDYFSGVLAPAAVYRHNAYVSTGVGLNFQYSSERDVFSSTVVGGSIIGLFNPYRTIQASVEFEQLYVNRDFDNQFITNIDDRYWYPALFLGLGFRSGTMAFGMRYDVLYDRNKSIQNQAWMPFLRFWF